MTPIDQMINELSPDGVAFERLADVGTWYGGGTPSKSRRDYWQDGTIPWVSPKDMGLPVVEVTQDYITEAAVKGSATKLVPPTSVAMVVRSSILDRIFPTALIPVPVALNQDMKAVVPRKDILPEYLAHVLRSQGEQILKAARKSGGSVASIESRNLFDFQIPIPPIAVQRAIVEILDDFCDLEMRLEGELATELRARQLQYAYYRDELVDFSEDNSVRRISMGDAGVFFGGLTGKSKADFTDGNARFVSYVNVLNNLAVDLERDDFVRIESGERQRALSRGDIIFTGSSETADDVGLSSVVTRSVTEPTYLNSFCIGYRLHDPDLLDPEFAKHLFRSSVMRQQIVKTASGVTRFNVSKFRLGKVEFPVPSKGEQSRIARILDSLETLVDSLSADLPAELTARRQQYEYYRGRLLTFEATSI